MDRKKLISSIYNSFESELPAEVSSAIKNIIEKQLSSRGSAKIFFRADDIGVPSKNFSCLMELFLKYSTPLCLAAVPCWMTRLRWNTMENFEQKGKSLFCWHMHGYRHVNHEHRGKKFEFGQSRSPQELFNDLSNGYTRLQSIMGKNLFPVFTPPWNRCSADTMLALQKLGFKGVSRSYNSKPSVPEGFENFPVHVDLHTRKEKHAKQGWQNLLKELDTGIQSSVCGIMIHHMRMNSRAFILLEHLLEIFSEYRNIKLITFKDLT